MKELNHIKGLTLIGTHRHPAIENGNTSIPLYALDGDINTVEGWNRRLLSQATSHFLTSMDACQTTM